MSKIFTKLQATPFYVERELADKILTDKLNKAPNTLLAISHSAGKVTCVIDDIKSVDITNDDDYKAKLRENTSNATKDFTSSNFDSWTDLETKRYRTSSPQDKSLQEGFSRLVWTLFRQDEYDKLGVQERVIHFFRENPNRTLPDVDTVVPEKTVKKHNPAEISCLTIIAKQLQNDRYYY